MVDSPDAVEERRDFATGAGAVGVVVVSELIPERALFFPDISERSPHVVLCGVAQHVVLYEGAVQGAQVLVSVPVVVAAELHAARSPGPVVRR